MFVVVFKVWPNLGLNNKFFVTGGSRERETLQWTLSNKVCACTAQTNRHLAELTQLKGLKV
jgi:hypothetical protein